MVYLERQKVTVNIKYGGLNLDHGTYVRLPIDLALMFGCDSRRSVFNTYVLVLVSFSDLKHNVQGSVGSWT